MSPGNRRAFGRVGLIGVGQAVNIIAERSIPAHGRFARVDEPIIGPGFGNQGGERIRAATRSM